MQHDDKIRDLEERLAAIERLSQKRQAEWDDVVSCWEDVLQEFCREFALELPEQLKQTESTKKGRTENLVKELSARQGVDAMVVLPYEEQTICLQGPVTVLVVTD